MDLGKFYDCPPRELWGEITARPRRDLTELRQTVEQVLDAVRNEGDSAVKRFEQQFDHVALAALQVTDAEMAEAETLVSDDLRAALTLAHENISRFHSAQQFVGQRVETAPGVVCWQKAVPIERVGLYIPGGTAPLFSTVLMLATPARIAGCREVVLCSPPNREGRLHPAILVAAKLAGVSKIFKIGGVQAIGAMAFGTESVPKVSKIFGPGNQFVMAAKQAVAVSDCAIDMPAGPSEVAVIADATSHAPFVAADLLSQAEHGMDSQVLLICTDRAKLEEIRREVARQLELLPRKEMAASSLSNSRFVLMDSLESAIELCNDYAPEHLILPLENADEVAEKVVNAGSVFIGRYSCESAGDYASGTNHTLPTSGWAKAYSGVSLDSFIRKITFQKLSPQGVESIAKAVETMAANEQLNAHERAMALRRGELENA